MFRAMEINEKQAVIGINWYELSGSPGAQRKQRASHVRAIGATHKVDVAGRGRKLLGLLVAPGGDVGVLSVSLAVWVAASASNTGMDKLVLVKQLADDEFWLCAAVSGLPVVRGDVIVGRDGLVAAIDDVGVGDDTEVKLLIDASDDEARRLAKQLGEFGEWGQIELSVLLGAGSTKAYVAATGMSVAAKAGSVLGVALLAAGAVGFWLYQESAAEQARLAALAGQVQRQVSPDELAAGAFARHFGTRPRMVAKDLVAAMWKDMAAKPFIQDGWTLGKLECDVVKNVCFFEYRRNGFAGDLRLDSAGILGATRGIDSVQAYVALPAAVLALPAKASVADLLAAYSGQSIADEALPTLRVARDFGMSAEIGQQAAVQAASIPGANMTVQEGHWSLSGDMALYDVVRRLPNSLMVDSATIEVKDDVVEFRVEGTYWVVVAAGKTAGPQGS